MTPEEFVKTYYPFAKESEQTTGISAIAQLAQGAGESGWGQKVKGNSIFGIKDTDGLNGNEILIRTTEYSTKNNLKFPVIHSIKSVTMNGVKMFKYDVEDYFRKFDTPKDSFVDHCQFFLKNPRYAKALTVKHDPIAFLVEVGKAGYATAPNYGEFMTSMVKSVLKRLPKK